MRHPRTDEKRVVTWTLGSADDAVPLRRDAAIVSVFAAVAVGSFLVPAGPFERTGLVALALTALVRVTEVHRAQRARARSRESIRADARGLTRVGGASSALVEWDKPFGLTLLARGDHERGLLVFTTPERTRYVPVSFEGDDPARAERLLALATPLADGDAAPAVHDEGALSPDSALELLAEAERRSPGATRRFYLSGTHDEPVVLEGEELRVGTRVFDLGAALEWRGFTFHEATGQSATLYQATWVRQGTTEAVLVAPLPPDLSAGAALETSPSDAERRARLRDLRLQHASPGAPPAREARVGIERLFMLPLRRALDGAPRASRSGMLKMRSGHTGGAASGP